MHLDVHVSQALHQALGHVTLAHASSSSDKHVVALQHHRHSGTLLGPQVRIGVSGLLVI